MSRAKAKRSAKKSARRSTDISTPIETQRRRLLGADAVIICCQRALDSQSGAPDELRVMDALQVASEIINDSVAALEAIAASNRA